MMHLGWRTSSKSSPTVETPASSSSRSIFTTLKYLLCECDKYVHHLMYDTLHDSWRLVFAVPPARRLCSTALRGARLIRVAEWRTRLVERPRWDALWRGLVNTTKQRVLNIRIHASMSAELVWLVELPEIWSWLPLWSPGKFPRKYVQPVGNGSSFILPESSLDPKRIMASSGLDEEAHNPSSASVTPVSHPFTLPSSSQQHQHCRELWDVVCKRFVLIG